MNVINKTIIEILESKISPIDVFAFFVFIEAICKAATEIENQIKARAENLENLEKLKQIAEKCK